ncbi:hypothetical protein [Actinomycetospora atypica]|uniref:Uncharacterized protein n=1 Tax=Actinomycetospora atypica TaxID=1290095 RepID=A0ABV9YNQ7_9PSEU
MREISGSYDGGAVGAARPVDHETDDRTHPPWCEFHAAGPVGGVEHYSRLLHWRPTYMSDVVVTGWLRRIRYADGSEETPTVVLEVDNAEHPGEIALSGEDLGSLAEHLLTLRGTLRG